MTLETISVNNIIRKKKKNLRQISPTFEKNTTYITRHALSHEGQCQVSKTSRVSPISIIVRQTGQNYAKNAMCSTITQQKHTRYETTLWYTPPQHYSSRCGPRVPEKKTRNVLRSSKWSVWPAWTRIYGRATLVSDYSACTEEYASTKGSFTSCSDDGAFTEPPCLCRTRRSILFFFLQTTATQSITPCEVRLHIRLPNKCYIYAAKDKKFTPSCSNNGSNTRCEWWVWRGADMQICKKKRSTLKKRTKRKEIA